MKKILLALFSVFFINLAEAQSIVSQTYYKDQYCSKISDDENAKYVRIETINDKGITTIEIRKTKNNALLSSISYKNGDTPTGIWRYYNNNGKLREQFNYDFDAPYSSPTIENAIYYDINKDTLVTKISGNFSPPILLLDKGIFNNYLAKNLRYPGYAVENNIQGKVKILIEISETGKTRIISIYKGVEKHIDIEAARVLHEIPAWKPAELNGKPIKVYSIVSITFQLS